MTLISAAELAAHLDDPDLRIADVRWSLAEPAAGRVAYAEAHLPGAIFVDLSTVLAAPSGPGRHPLPDPATFVAAMGALGIGRRHFVVAYDDAGGTVAARLWWMLDVVGHPRTAVLDGGIVAWRDAGLPLKAEAPGYSPVAPDELATLEEMAAWPRTIDRATLTRRLGTLTVLDARAPERYRGDIEPIDPVAGHIPTATSAPTTSFLGPDGRFLGPDALRAQFAAVGVPVHPSRSSRTVGARGPTPAAIDAAEAGAAPAAGSSAEVAPGAEASGGRPVVVACGSGVNACQLALAMRAAGLPDPLLYPGSYSDWSRSGMPIATGDEPGLPPA